jgi:hypothetical protein
MPLGRQHKKHGLPFCRQPMLPGLMLTQVLSGLFASAVAPVSQSLVSESVQEPVLGMRYVNCQRTCRTHMHIICYIHYTHMFLWVENAYNIHTPIHVALYTCDMRVWPAWRAWRAWRAWCAWLACRVWRAYIHSCNFMHAYLYTYQHTEVPTVGYYIPTII